MRGASTRPGKRAQSRAKTHGTKNPAPAKIRAGSPKKTAGKATARKSAKHIGAKDPAAPKRVRATAAKAAAKPVKAKSAVTARRAERADPPNGAGAALKKKAGAKAAVKSPKSTARAAAKAEAKNPVLHLVCESLRDDKANDLKIIDLHGKSSLADYMIVVSGTSTRHLATMAEHLREKLKAKGLGPIPIEGLNQSDWVLIDAGDVVVHLFRPEVRKFYNLEKMWSTDFAEPESAAEHAAL